GCARIVAAWPIGRSWTRSQRKSELGWVGHGAEICSVIFRIASAERTFLAVGNRLVFSLRKWSQRNWTRKIPWRLSSWMTGHEFGSRRKSSRASSNCVTPCASRPEPRGQPRERYGVADVLKLADPLDESLHPHAKARVLNATVPSAVDVPIVCFRVFALFLEALPDGLEVRLALAAADNLANAVAPDHVECKDEVRMLRIPALVEGLGDPRVVGHDDRLRLALGQRAFLEGP